MIHVAKTPLPSIHEYSKYIKKIWQSHWVTNDGDFVKKLEVELKKIFGINNLTLVSNGTLGLQLAIKAFGLKGEIITTPFTFAATTNVILWEGLTPVFADINPETFNIDPKEVEKKITKNTAAILAVHVFGNPCDIVGLSKIAKKHNIKLIFDAAHAFGVGYKNRSVLEYGDASVLSFHATKTFHTIEGGAIVSKNKKVENKLRLMRNFGIVSEEKVLLCGINAKMNEFQAAMGLSNIPYISSILTKRKNIYNEYKKELVSIRDIVFQHLTTEDYNYSYMPVLFKTKRLRDLTYFTLEKNGIKARKYFYPLTSNFPYVKKTISHSFFPNANKISNSILCLPIFADMKIGEVKKITSVIKNVYEEY